MKDKGIVATQVAVILVELGILAFGLWVLFKVAERLFW